LSLCTRCWLGNHGERGRCLLACRDFLGGDAIGHFRTGSGRPCKTKQDEVRFHRGEMKREVLFEGHEEQQILEIEPGHCGVGFTELHHQDQIAFANFHGLVDRIQIGLEVAGDGAAIQGRDI